MTLKEATENGVDYWEFFVLVEGKQIHVASGMVKRCWYFERNDTVSINNLSAPAGLEAVREGNGWCKFQLGDGTLIVWPSEVKSGL
jgi:hypothetical protein